MRLRYSLTVGAFETLIAGHFLMTLAHKFSRDPGLRLRASLSQRIYGIRHGCCTCTAYRVVCPKGRDRRLPCKYSGLSVAAGLVNR